VPNPAKARALAAVSAARGDVATAHAQLSEAIDAATLRARLSGSGGKATVDPAAHQVLTAAETALAVAQAASRTTVSHLPLAQVRPDSRKLESERKLLTHAIRMSAYNSESALARLLRPHYARGQDEARSLLREAFTLPGDLQIIGDTLHVRHGPSGVHTVTGRACTRQGARCGPGGTDRQQVRRAGLSIVGTYAAGTMPEHEGSPFAQ